ncbi:MAG: hypothetical protein IPJ21_10020 [Sterolibacteriaceae bacterium]|nr:hypothetical protein [Sterolibacteriaceae bacterium]MBK9084199.1 hypothetical protein [Sterolibacteriaceae bacterium]
MTPAERTDDQLPRESLGHLLFRFIWPFRYFRDVTRGSLLERQMNYRHNRAMRVFLPGFVLKWVALTALWFAIGGLFDQFADWVIPAACCFMTGSWTFIVALLLLTSWAWLERFPELYDQPARVHRMQDREH